MEPFFEKQKVDRRVPIVLGICIIGLVGTIGWSINSTQNKIASEVLIANHRQSREAQHQQHSGPPLVFILDRFDWECVVAGDYGDSRRAGYNSKIRPRPEPGDVFETTLDERNNIFLLKKSDSNWRPRFIKPAGEAN